MPRSLLEGFSFQGESSESAAIEALYNIKSIDRLRMTTEVTPDLVFPLACLEVIVDRYKSKVLRQFAQRLYQIEISKDRKGRLELVETLLSIRKPEGGEE